MLLKKYSLSIAIGLTLIASVYAYFQFLLPLDVFLWDESHHGFFGMQIFNDLRAADWGSFWEHTNHQALWMPLHSWISGLFLLIFGFSYTSARSASLFLFFLSSILLYLTALQMSKQKGWLIGLIAAALFITSPQILSLATLNMQEMLGIFGLLGLVYLMFRFLAVEAPWKYLAIGLLISLSYWMKLNFALQAILGVGLFQLSLLWPRKKEEAMPAPIQGKKYVPKKAKVVEKKNNKLAAWCLDNVYILLGFLPLFVLWWATPPFERKFQLGFVFRTQGVGDALFYPSVNFLGRVIFYLQSIVSSYNFSLWLGLGCLIAIVVSCRRWDNQQLRLAICLFAANLVIVSIGGNVQERYISTTAPLVFLLAAYWSVRGAARIKLKSAVSVATIAALTILIVGDLLSLTRYTKEAANRSILFPIYRDSLNRFSPPFLFGLAPRPAWTYPMEQKKKYNNFTGTPNSRLQDVLNYFSSTIDRSKSISTFISYDELSPYVLYWHFLDWGAPVFSVNDFQVSSGYFWNSEYYLDLQAATGSPYESDWIEKRWNEIGPKLLQAGYIRRASFKEFPDLGLTATIYQRTRSFFKDKQ